MGLLYVDCESIKWNTHTRKTGLECLIKINLDLGYHPTILPRGMTQEKWGHNRHKENCLRIFFCSFICSCQNLGKLKCPSAEEKTNCDNIHTEILTRSQKIVRKYWHIVTSLIFDTMSSKRNKAHFIYRKFKDKWNWSMITEMRKVGGCGGTVCQRAEKKHKKTFWSEKCPGYQLHESTRLSILSELHT